MHPHLNNGSASTKATKSAIFPNFWSNFGKIIWAPGPFQSYEEIKKNFIQTESSTANYLTVSFRLIVELNYCPPAHLCQVMLPRHPAFTASLD